MLRHYFTATIRNFRRNRFFWIINLLGLTVGMALFILIRLWVGYEKSFDTFHVNSERIFQVLVDMTVPGKPVTIWSTTPAQAGPIMSEKIPEIEAVIRTTWQMEVIIRQDQNKIIKNAIYADSLFFRYFTFPLISGDPEKALAHRDGLVITKAAARSIFGDIDPAGKVLQIKESFTGEARDVVVTGVCDDLPPNSRFSFDMIMPFETYLTYTPWNREWGNYNQTSFAVLRPFADISETDKKIADFIGENRPDADGDSPKMFLHPLKKLHLYDDFSKGRYAEGTIVYVRLFNMISFFVLIIACINYINLSTANSIRRNKEVGLKKTIGASGRTLYGQFMFESFLINMIALILSVIIIQSVLPGFNHYFNKHVTISFSGSFIFLTAAMLISSTLLSGFYPSFVFTSVKPVSILKGEPGRTGKFGLRNGLVIFQFALSISMIIGIIVVLRQVKYIRDKNLGFDRENVIRFIPGAAQQHQDAFRQELMNIPGIISVSFTDQNPLYVSTSTSDPDWDNKSEDDNTFFQVIQADRYFINTLGITLIEGENFPEKVNPSINQYLVNEKAAEAMGMKDPVGESLGFWNDNEGKIIGLVRDFNHQSLHQEIRPLIIYYNPDNGWNAFVKISGENTNKVIEAVKSVYLGFEKERPFDYHFLDNDFENMYKREALMQRLTLILTLMAVLISSLGLFGLSLFTIQCRTKEIAIRKVSGADTGHLIALVSWDFIRWIFISFIIASPLAWYFLNGWLENFAYRTSISWWIYALAGSLAIIIALATVGYHSFKAAAANPVNALKYE